MIKVLADKDIPYLDEVFETSKDYQLTKLSFDEITSNSLKDIDALLSRSATPLNGILFDGTKVKFAGSLTSGEDHINFNETDNLKIEVNSAKGCNAQAVTEYILDALSVSNEKRLGIIGQGFVGSKLKKVLEAYDYEIKTYDPYLYEHDEKTLNDVLSFPLISVHSSYSKAGKFPSHNLISSLNANQLLINTSRGEIVDYVSIDNSSKARLICDVWNNEPNLDREDIKNTFRATPHIAGNTFEAKINALNIISRKLDSFFDKKDLRKLVIKTKVLEVNPKTISKSLDNNLLPFELIDFFSPCNKVSSIFKKNIKEVKTDINFVQEFQKIRKSFERKGFGEYALAVNKIKSSQQEQLSLLGFEIHRE
jgi:erythronate-4-phosphate dehydrogenase|tara:strand:- start:1839 stop:2936 length:1098 start_codon:yes stop_codon:yes gene_type:complete